MKTAKFLFTFCLMLFSIKSVLAGDSPTNDLQNVETNNYCSCACEACKNCSQRDPDKEVYYDEYNYRVMNSRDFSEFKKLITDRTFESTKMDMTKSVIDNNLFTVDQVREILSWFTFESNKLELAKYVFRNTVNRNNYFKLYDIFVFESNVTELDSYIKNNK